MNTKVHYHIHKLRHTMYNTTAVQFVSAQKYIIKINLIL
jgi:hypothetical protein